MKQIKKVLGEGLHKYTMVIALIALVIFFNIASEGKMITPSNFQNLLSGNAYVLILAIGMLMVIVVSNIPASFDLLCHSFGSSFCLLGGVYSAINTNFLHFIYLL